jgi:restriction endonuclease S subunit
MEIKEMNIEELEARKLEIVNELETDGADLDALEAETKSINAELETRKAEEAKKAEVRQAVTEGAVAVVAEFKEEKREMKTNEEIRASK